MPNTTSGLRRRMARRLCQNASSSMAGSNSFCSTPLPRTPPIDTHTMSMPACGTTRASRPFLVPSQNTSQPRARKASATASAG